jgi:two-component system, OmpR family, phosphate regulon sensor histidine kinase PhoR
MACCCSLPTNRSAGATRSRPITSVWIRSAIGASASPTSCAHRLSSRTCEGLLLVLSNDVTERLKAEAMRRDFVANVSHEIRTPLTVLAGFVETLATLPVTEAERKRMLTLMTQQAQRMQALVADLLTLARLEGSPRPPVDQWVPLQQLWDAVETQTRQLSQGRHVLVFGGLESGDLADHGPLAALELAGSESELLSAFGNLCSNAVRYTPAGGRIELLWRHEAHGDGCFEVRDTGLGIAREHLARLTERFYRVDGSRSRETGGTGLGLSIVKHVMQRHGGRLEIDSEPGRGSTFRLVLPAVRLRQASAEGFVV